MASLQRAGCQGITVEPGNVSGRSLGKTAKISALVGFSAGGEGPQCDLASWCSHRDTAV